MMRTYARYSIRIGIAAACLLGWGNAGYLQRAPAQSLSDYLTNPHGANAYLVSAPSATASGSGTTWDLLENLNGAPNLYGPTGGNPKEDILYEGAQISADSVQWYGQTAQWTFTLPSYISPSNVASAYFTSSMVADDIYHTTPPVDPDFAYNVWTYTGSQTTTPTNNVTALGTFANLPHGSPSGGPFTNWTTSGNFAVTNPSSSPTYTLVTHFDPQPFLIGYPQEWIGINTIDLHLTLNSPVDLSPSTPAPEPPFFQMAGLLGLGGLCWMRRRLPSLRPRSVVA